jgi:hypothetical protein
MYQEIKLAFKDGTFDWVSPVESNNIKFKDNLVVVNNDCFEYEYVKNDIATMSIYFVEDGEILDEKVIYDFRGIL